MEHWSFAARLLRGTWDYEPTGLFDTTHLRWFSLETMRRAAGALGLVPCDVHPRIFDAEQGRELRRRARHRRSTALGVDRGGYAQRAAPLQYVWRVRKRPRQICLTIAGNMLKPVGGVSACSRRLSAAGDGDRSDVSRPSRGSGEVTGSDRDAPQIFVLHRPILNGRSRAAMIRGLLAEAGWS